MTDKSSFWLHKLPLKIELDPANSDQRILFQPFSVTNLGKD